MSDRDEGCDRLELLEGRYANFFKVGYNPFEFVLDFGQEYPPDERIVYHLRIITSPIYAKAFLTTMQESVKKYEETFGLIADVGD